MEVLITDGCLWIRAIEHIVPHKGHRYPGHKTNDIRHKDTFHPDYLMCGTHSERSCLSSSPSSTESSRKQHWSEFHSRLQVAIREDSEGFP